MYGPWLRAIVAIFIASLAFRLGRQSIIDRVEQDVRKLQKVLKNRSMYSLSMPKQLERLSSIKKVVMAANLILFSAVSVKAMKIKIALLKSLHLTFLLQVFIVALFALLFIWGYQLYLTSAIEKGRKISMLINEELYSLMQLVGSRGESIVRAHLCKEKYAKRQKHPVGVCFKEDCREARKYLKIKADLM
jgi:ABC-type multidrug transport system fused ATPase/permease subunit